MGSFQHGIPNHFEILTVFLLPKSGAIVNILVQTLIFWP